MNIDQMLDALTEDEIVHLQSLSSKNLFHYVRDNIIPNLPHLQTDDEVREIYYATIGQFDETE